jgi:hypothetical protein
MAEEDKERRRQLANRAHKLRNMGKPRRVLPHEYRQAVEILKRAHDERGMTYRQIGYQLELCDSTLGKHLSGQGETMYRETYERILRLQPEMIERQKDRHSGGHVSLVGSQRRLRALMAMGWGMKTVAPIIGMDVRNLAKILLGKVRYVYAATAEDIKIGYDKLITMDPFEHSPQISAVKNVKRQAAERLYPGPECWDDDTIDDPDAVPEWTGACGTAEGYYLHLKYEILIKWSNAPSGKRRRVLCQPCVNARAETEGLVNGVMTDEDAIKEALRNHRTHRDIAADFGVSTRTVQRYAAELKKTGWVPNPKGPRRKEDRS